MTAVRALEHPQLLATLKWSLEEIEPDEIARIANCNVRTAKNWKAGENFPNYESLARLVREVPRLAAVWRWIGALEADLDPRAEQEFNRFLAGLFGRAP